MPHHRKIFRSVAFAEATFIFAKRELQNPMEAVLNAPALTDALRMVVHTHTSQTFGVRGSDYARKVYVKYSSLGTHT